MIVKILATILALNIYLPINNTTHCETATMILTEWSVGQGEYKCYMDYRTITDTTSPQWHLQQRAYTDKSGLRKVKDMYCVALGSAYGTEVGARYLVELETGRRFRCILADQKADKDTNADHTADTNGAVIEFIVDDQALNNTVRRMGDVSYINGMQGKVRKIYKEVLKWNSKL